MRYELFEPLRPVWMASIVRLQAVTGTHFLVPLPRSADDSQWGGADEAAEHLCNWFERIA